MTSTLNRRSPSGASRVVRALPVLSLPHSRATLIHCLAAAAVVVSNQSVWYATSGSTFPELLYRLDLGRTGGGNFMIYLLLWPQILLSLCASFTMFFPPNDSRLGFCMTLFLSVQFLKLPVYSQTGDTSPSFR